MKLSIHYLLIKFGYLCANYRIFNFFWFYLKKIIIDPKQKEKLKAILNTDEKEIIDEYSKKKNKILKQIKSIKKWSSVFIPLLDWWSWDIAYRFIYLKEIFYYLENKWCKIYIIAQEKFSDIINLIGQYFNIIHLKSNNSEVNINNIIAEDIEIKETIEKNQWIILNHYLFIAFGLDQKLFYKTWNKKWGVFWSSYDFADFLNKELNWWKKLKLNKKEYVFDKNKIKNVIWYGNTIICNYESKALNMPCFDRVKFDTYLKKTYTIWKEIKRNIIVNSVYNKEKIVENEWISIKRLTFHEILYLADKNLIDVFISERNWLNDIFYVFFPNIKQIIYYPEGCWFLTKFNKWDLWTDENYDISLLNYYWLPEWNNIQDYRKNFLMTIKKYLNNYLN